MKTRFGLLFFSMTLSCAAGAKPKEARLYDCGDTRGEWYSEYVTLNSPDEYDGPGEVDSCRADRTFMSRKEGWRVTYICHVSLEKSPLTAMNRTEH